MSTTALHRLLAVAAATAVGAATALAPGAAHAVDPTDTLADGLLSPLSVAVSVDDITYFSQNFAGTLHRKKPGKKVRTIYTSPKGKEVGAISTRGKRVYFVHGGNLMRRNKRGEISKVASIAAYEKTVNPDGETTYGLPDGTAQECVDAWPTGEGFPPATYDGIAESHPYATAVSGSAVYVVDAGGNTILRYASGALETVAVLDPVLVEITAELAEQFEIPEACVGESYRFEGVPTDVEVGGDGLLYVSSLPGGEVPGYGSVLTIDPADGAQETVVSGLVAATGVAVDDNGDIYVCELFKNTLTKVPAGGEPEPFWEGEGAPGPAAVEIRNGILYASVNALTGLSGEPGDVPMGQVVTWGLVD